LHKSSGNIAIKAPRYSAVSTPVGGEDKSRSLARDCCIMTTTAAPSADCKLSVHVNDRQTDRQDRHTLSSLMTFLPLRGASEGTIKQQLYCQCFRLFCNKRWL